MNLRVNDILYASNPHAKVGFHGHEEDEKLMEYGKRYPLLLPQTHMMFASKRDAFLKGTVDDQLFQFLSKYKKQVFFLFSEKIHKDVAHMFETALHEFYEVGQKEKNPEVSLTHLCIKNITRTDLKEIKDFFWGNDERYYEFNFFSIEEDPIIEPFFIEFPDEDMLYYGEKRLNMIIHFNQVK